MEEFIFLVVLGLIAWYWVGSIQAKELAVTVARRGCEQHGVQLLDQTVALRRTRLARNTGGSLWLERHFRFEFSEGGNDRNFGQVRVRGHLPVHIALEGAGIGRVVIGPDAE